MSAFLYVIIFGSIVFGSCLGAVIVLFFVAVSHSNLLDNYMHLSLMLKSVIHYFEKECSECSVHLYKINGMKCGHCPLNKILKKAKKELQNVG